MVKRTTDEIPSDLGFQLALAAGARPTDHLVVANGGIELVIDLMRHGFQDVACARGTLVGDEPDVLLIPDVTSTEQLGATLVDLGRRAPTAVLYLASDQRLEPLESLLNYHGFSILECRRCGRGFALKARKLGAIALVSAA